MKTSNFAAQLLAPRSLKLRCQINMTSCNASPTFADELAVEEVPPELTLHSIAFLRAFPLEAVSLPSYSNANAAAFGQVAPIDAGNNFYAT